MSRSPKKRSTPPKQRLMTSTFDYYELAHPGEGVSSGFKYKTFPHVTLKSIANNPEIREGMTREQIDAAIRRCADQETNYDQPLIDSKRVRISGPFTVEAVPAPAVFPMAGKKDGWAKLAKNLKAEIDIDRIEADRGTASLPFHAGIHKRIAVKIIDDRGIESLRVINLGG